MGKRFSKDKDDYPVPKSCGDNRMQFIRVRHEACQIHWRPLPSINGCCLEECFSEQSKQGACDDDVNHISLKRNNAISAASAMSPDIQSKRCAHPCGHRTCNPKKVARFNMTPTTAAVMAVRGAVNWMS